MNSRLKYNHAIRYCAVSLLKARTTFTLHCAIETYKITQIEMLHDLHTNAVLVNCKTARLNGPAAARLVQPFRPVIKNAGQCGQTRPVGGRRTAKWKRTCAVSTFVRLPCSWSRP